MQSQPWSERLERGGPLLNVETEVNGDSKSTSETGTSLVGSLGLSCQFKRSALAAIVDAVHFASLYSTLQYYNSFVPIV